MYQPDEYIQKALLTWYPKDHDLHFEPLHPAIKLAGEAGEILDLYGKNEFKPGFNWWDCKHCGYGDASHSFELRKCPDLRNVYTPKVLDELGDWVFYARILMYLSEKNTSDFDFKANHNDILTCINGINFQSVHMLDFYLKLQILDVDRLATAYEYFLRLLDLLDTSLDELIEMNYIKLNSDATNHGWKGA